MSQGRRDLLQRVVSRPALGAVAALLLCALVLAVALALPTGPTQVILAFIGAFSVGLALITLGVVLVGHLLGIDRRSAETAAGGRSRAARRRNPAGHGKTAESSESEESSDSAESAEPADPETLDEEPLGLSIDLREDQPAARPSTRAKTRSESGAQTRSKTGAKTLSKIRGKEDALPEPIVLPPPPSGRVHITE